MKNYKKNYAIIGFILGMGAPLGALVLRALVSGPLGRTWFHREITTFGFFYNYMLLTTPVVFALFGYYLGVFMHKFHVQKTSLEGINVFLKEQSIIDELTGFYNRRHLLVEIEKEVERARRYKHTMVGIMIDVDDFKKFNDKYGHLFGDQVLKGVAGIFDHCIRTIDILGRYGGDEFIIILPEATYETGHLVADRIKKAVRAHAFKFKNRTVKVTVSIGAYFFENLSEIDKAAFIESIDKSLFQAKNLGKNRVHMTHPAPAHKA